MPDHNAELGGLFELPATYAKISDDGLYRYTLGRRWAPLDGPGAAVFVMLNPSTADATADDPTIRRCIGFAKSLGCGGLHVVNLYAYRATKPADLWRIDVDPIGPDNDEVLRETFAAAAREDRPVIAAWGTNAEPLRADFAGVLAQAAGVRLTALGTTKHGAPRHPLYLRADARPQPYPPAPAVRDASSPGCGRGGCAANRGVVCNLNCPLNPRNPPGSGGDVRG